MLAERKFTHIHNEIAFAYLLDSWSQLLYISLLNIQIREGKGLSGVPFELGNVIWLKELLSDRTILTTLKCVV